MKSNKEIVDEMFGEDPSKEFFFLPMIVITKIPNGNIRFDIGLFWFALTIWKKRSDL